MALVAAFNFAPEIFGKILEKNNKVMKPGEDGKLSNKRLYLICKPITDDTGMLYRLAET